MSLVFAANLRAARARLGVSQSAIAAAVGIKQTLLSKFERGTTEPRICILVKLAASLGCLPGDLLDGYSADTCAPEPARRRPRSENGIAHARTPVQPAPTPRQGVTRHGPPPRPPTASLDPA